FPAAYVRRAIYILELVKSNGILVLRTPQAKTEHTVGSNHLQESLPGARQYGRSPECITATNRAVRSSRFSLPTMNTLTCNLNRSSTGKLASRSQPGSAAQRRTLFAPPKGASAFW